MLVRSPQALQQPQLVRKEKRHHKQAPDIHLAQCFFIMLMLSLRWMRLRLTLLTLFSLWRTLKLRPVKHKRIRRVLDDF